MLDKKLLGLLALYKYLFLVPINITASLKHHYNATIHIVFGIIILSYK